MGLKFEASDYILSILYKGKLKEFKEKFEDMKNPKVIFVTDLTSCSHRRALRFKFPELTLKFEPQMILGDLLHLGLESILEGEGFEKEVPVESTFKLNGEEYIVKGRVDALSKDLVVEIKTGRKGQNIPHPHHIMQLQIYMNLLNRDRGILIYITPDKMVEYSVVREPLDLNRLVEETVKDTVHPRWRWECKYCVYSRMCPFKVEGGSEDSV